MQTLIDEMAKADVKSNLYREHTGCAAELLLDHVESDEADLALRDVLKACAHGSYPAIQLAVQTAVNAIDEEPKRSECCGAFLIGETDLCSECYEHC